MFDSSIFNLNSETSFKEKALAVFNYQAQNNPVYKSFLNFLNCNPEEVKQIKDIPFLPISFFKSHNVLTGQDNEEICFLSSGTTGQNQKQTLCKLFKTV